MIQSRERLERIGCRWSQHAVAVTMKDSKLDQKQRLKVGSIALTCSIGWAAAPPLPVRLVCCRRAGIDSDAFRAVLP